MSWVSIAGWSAARAEGAPQASKPRDAAQPGEPGTSPRPGSGCSKFVRKGSCVQITSIGTAPDVSRTWTRRLTWPQPHMIHPILLGAGVEMRP